MLQIQKFEDRGAGLAAVFWDEIESREIVLNEPSLRMRIENMKAADLDVSAENAALAEMVRMKAQPQEV
jgi:hypothetical protein